MKFLSLFILLSTVLPFSQAQAQVVPGSMWENQRGSVLRVKTVNPDGSFEGTYINNAAGFSCRGTPYQVTGWLNQDAIGWVVNWKSRAADCKSITSWAGVMVSPKIIETIWSLGFTSPYKGASVIVGSDDFFKQ